MPFPCCEIRGMLIEREEINVVYSGIFLVDQKTVHPVRFDLYGKLLIGRRFSKPGKIPESYDKFIILVITGTRTSWQGIQVIYVHPPRF